jgi:hypothetical protein
MAALPDSRGSVSVPSRARQQSASLLIVVLGLAVSSIPARSASVRLTFESPPVKVFLDEKAPAESPTARLLLVRGEHRSLQFLMTAGERKLESVTVRSSFAAGARLSAEVGLVGYVRTSPKDWRPCDKTEQTAKIGWWPDPLLPNRSFDVLPGETQPVRITVFAPPGTRASNYKAGLTVVLAPGQRHELSYTVRVVDVDLPAAQTFRNAAFMPAGNFSAHYRPKGDLAGEEFLAIGWLTYRYRVSGFEYWGLNQWGENTGRRDWANFATGDTRTSWKRTHWPWDDGWLLYPGDKGEPLSSIRFENLRDGFEDAELLRLLASRDGQAEADRIAHSIARSTSDYASDPAEIERARLALLEAIARVPSRK